MKGFLACPVCGPNTVSRSAKGLKKTKQVFVGAHRWTRRGHPYRSKMRFNGEVETEGAPPRQSATDKLRATRDRETYLLGREGGRLGRPDGPLDPYRRHGVRRRSRLYDLPYWQVRFQQVFSFIIYSYF
jgi:hypothetical protein